MRGTAWIAGSLILLFGIAVGFVLDHFTIWTGPKPNSLQLIGALALLGFTIALAITFILDQGTDHGPET